MQNQYNFLQAFLITLAIILGLFIAMNLLFMALDRSEKVECLKLEKQSEEYPNFYWTDWQKEMCKKYE